MIFNVYFKDKMMWNVSRTLFSVNILQYFWTSLLTQNIKNTGIVHRDFLSNFHFAQWKQYPHLTLVKAWQDDLNFLDCEEKSSFKIYLPYQRENKNGSYFAKKWGCGSCCLPRLCKLSKEKKKHSSIFSGGG